MVRFPTFLTHFEVVLTPHRLRRYMQLKAGSNLLLYGFGSKRKLINVKHSTFDGSSNCRFDIHIGTCAPQTFAKEWLCDAPGVVTTPFVAASVCVRERELIPRCFFPVGQRLLPGHHHPLGPYTYTHRILDATPSPPPHPPFRT